MVSHTAALQPYEILRCPPAYAAIPHAAGTQFGCDHRYAGLSLHLSPYLFYHSFRLFFHWRLFCSTIYPIIVLFYLHEQLAKRPERLELQQVKTAIKSILTAIKSTLAGAFVQSSSAKTHYHMTPKVNQKAKAPRQMSWGFCVGATYLSGPSPAKYCQQKRA